MSTREADKNRWLIAAAAVAIHLSIGSTYAYSIYQVPLNETQGWFLVITCYGGGGFACLPAYLSDLFGTKEVSTIHGYALTAWGVTRRRRPTPSRSRTARAPPRA